MNLNGKKPEDWFKSDKKSSDKEFYHYNTIFNKVDDKVFVPQFQLTETHTNKSTTNTLPNVEDLPAPYLRKCYDLWLSLQDDQESGVRIA